MHPIPLLDRQISELGAPFYRLGRDDIQQIYDVMRAATGLGVVPPDFNTSVDDAARLFDLPSDPKLTPALGVFGLFDNGRLTGFVALTELNVDTRPHLEFYIFLRPDWRSPGIAIEGAKRLTHFARSQVGYPICTLVYSANERGKKFYTKAGFHFDRQVNLEEMPLELWIWREPEEGFSVQRRGHGN